MGWAHLDGVHGDARSQTQSYYSCTVECLPTEQQQLEEEIIAPSRVGFIFCRLGTIEM
jgi:hypothetical protein